MSLDVGGRPKPFFAAVAGGGAAPPDWPARVAWVEGEGAASAAWGETAGPGRLLAAADGRAPLLRDLAVEGYWLQLWLGGAGAPAMDWLCALIAVAPLRRLAEAARTLGSPDYEAVAAEAAVRHMMALWTELARKGTR